MASKGSNSKIFNKSQKTENIRLTNIAAAKCTEYFYSVFILLIALADVVRTSLGPRGMDKMI